MELDFPFRIVKARSGYHITDVDRLVLDHVHSHDAAFARVRQLESQLQDNLINLQIDIRNIQQRNHT